MHGSKGGAGTPSSVTNAGGTAGSRWHRGKEKTVSDTIPGNESHVLESFNQGRKERKDPGTNQKFSALTHRNLS